MKIRRQKTTLVCLHDTRSPVSEAYRTMRTNIQFSGICNDLKALMVTSAGPGEGKTTTIANLAIAFAQTGKRVVLMDGDMRRSAVHRIFNLPNVKGLSNLLIDGSSLESVIQHPAGVKLDIITAGNTVSNQAELLVSPLFPELIRQLKNSYDLVLSDSPPIIPVTDAQLLAGYMDGIFICGAVGDCCRGRSEKGQGTS